jgi:hypothetical protein
MALLAQVQPNECDPKEHFQKKGILTTTTEREFQNALWTRSQTLFLRLFFFFFLSTSFPFWPEAASSYLSLPTLYNLPPPPWFAHSAFARHIHQVSFWYRQERKSLHPFSRTMCAGGGIMVDKEHDPGQGRERAARMYSALILVYYSVDYYISERKKRENREKNSTQTLCTPRYPLWSLEIRPVCFHYRKWNETWQLTLIYIHATVLMNLHAPIDYVIKSRSTFLNILCPFRCGPLRHVNDKLIRRSREQKGERRRIKRKWETFPEKSQREMEPRDVLFLSILTRTQFLL